MWEAVLPEGSRARQVFLQVLCPNRARSFKSYSIKTGTGLVFYQGGWRSISGIIRRRERARSKPHRAKKRDWESRNNDRRKETQRLKYALKTPAQKRVQSQRRNENRKRTREATNARIREWYQSNQGREFKKILDRRKANNPAHGLYRAISEYRRGRITLDVLIGLCKDAGARSDRLFERADEARENKPSSGCERMLKPGKGHPGEHQD